MADLVKSPSARPFAGRKSTSAMNKPRSDLKDVEFVIEEIWRFLRMSQTDLLEHIKKNKIDAFCTIRNPVKNGDLIIGRQAQLRILSLAERHLAAQTGFNFDISSEEFAAAVQDAFAQFFIKEDREVDTRNIDRMLSFAVRRSKEKFKPTTHYLPCVLVGDEDPNEFEIGPVRFVRTEKFLSEHNPKIEETRKSIEERNKKACENAVVAGYPKADVCNPEQSAQIAEQLVQGLLKYLSLFNWVAIVTVPQCGEDVSRERAEASVEAALNVLKLLLGSTYAGNLRLGHLAGKHPNTASLKQSGYDPMSISLHWKAGEAFLGEGWLEKIKAIGDGFHFRAAGFAVASCLHPASRTHLQQRFVDALQWYGQALAEPQPSMKLTKFVAAWERLTLGIVGQKVTQTVTRRIAALSQEDRSGYERQRVLAVRIYDCRSRLVHGDLSPYSTKVGTLMPDAEHITRIALLHSLEIYVWLDKQLGIAKPRDLDEEFGRICEPS